MSGPTETYRGVVAAWECDVFAHLTIAYYFDRFPDASAALRHKIDLQGARTTGLVVRYLKELRAGDGLHIESGVIGEAGGGLVFGHRVLDSATGEVTSTVEESLAVDKVPGEAGAYRIAWETPAGDDPPAPQGWIGFVDTARDAVRVAETNAKGQLTIPGYVHRFSGACLQLVGRFGMTPDYMRRARRGFSTFETRLRLDGPRPRAGDLVVVRSAVAQLGNSSIRVVHRMQDARTEAPLATFHQSGVHFDMDARRSAPWPEELRDKGRAMAVA
jgi:acyl-CoA thioester hydrolase